jgi:hypothetical protein
MKRRRAILDTATLLEKGIKISNSCEHRRNKIMINMLSKWRIGRILLKKKIRLLNQVLFFVSNGLTYIDA